MEIKQTFSELIMKQEGKSSVGTATPTADLIPD